MSNEGEKGCHRMCVSAVLIHSRGVIELERMNRMELSMVFIGENTIHLLLYDWRMTDSLNVHNLHDCAI
jgi:hypothetical protein